MKQGKVALVSDALPFEYKRNYGCAVGELELSDLVNYPPLASEFRRHGLSFPEETLRLISIETRSFRDDGPNPFLVSVDTV